MRIIDFHTHTFPDAIAGAAIAKLRAASRTRPFSDGTQGGLQKSMAAAGIELSLVLPVATSARQVPHVNDASIALNARWADTGILSLGCMHPDFEGWHGELKRLADAGIRGIKLHPVYQGVDFDDPRYLRILDRAGELGLLVLIHAGLDVGFPGVVHASVPMILRALKAVGPLTLVLAHMGGWRCWDEAEALLPAAGVYIDTSFSLGHMTPDENGRCKNQQEWALLGEEQFIRMVRAFGAEHVLFGTDSPWGEQAAEVQRLMELPFTPAERRAILHDNAARLLGLPL